MIYNQDDENIRKIVATASCQKIGFSASGLQQNYAAARAVGELCGLTTEVIDQFFKDFKGVKINYFYGGRNKLFNLLLKLLPKRTGACHIELIANK